MPKKKIHKMRARNSPEENKMLFYDTLAVDFDSVVNQYDTNKRLRVVFDELLSDTELQGLKVLDAGCGTGWFSQVAAQKKAKVTSLDIGENLLKEVAKKCKTKCVVGSIMELPFADNTFDVVISSEVIEHVTDPVKGISECVRVTKPGGLIIMTTPNRFWHWSLSVAHFFGVRRYDGLENWLSYSDFSIAFTRAGGEIEKQQGIHLFPFVVPFLNPILDLTHHFRVPLGPVMVNMAIRARKSVV
ncbi:MAG: class I SAM-dependent methyltransferase [bacterium]|nr:class I SAM-dependent methyltransferase [bacterium]